LGSRLSGIMILEFVELTSDAPTRLSNDAEYNVSEWVEDQREGADSEKDRGLAVHRRWSGLI